MNHRLVLDQIGQDLRYAWRGLRQSPAFFATAVLTLAIGLGIATVAFTIFSAYVLRPFAVRDPSSLHQISWHSRDDGGSSFRWRDYEELRDRRDLFDAVIAEHTRFVSSNGRPLVAALTSDNYFQALAPRLVLGRTFTPADPNGVVLGYQAWARLFNRDPSAITSEIDLNGHQFAIVGILGPEFTGLDESPRDVWVPLAAYSAVALPELTASEQPRAIEMTVRLRRGVSAAQAQNALVAFVSRAIEKQDVHAEVRRHDTPNPLSLQLLAIVSPVLAAFALVLVTACANVSNVMLARAIARQREIAVRLSLGASRGRVVRQLLTEGLLIAVLAGAAGLVFTAWAVRAAMAAISGTLPPSVAAIVRIAPVWIDVRVFVFVLAAAAAATMLFALLPALQASRVTLTDALRGHDGGARHASRLRSALVVGQVAVSLVLVIVALTLARNAGAIGAIDLGFDADAVISVNVRGPEGTLVPRLAAVLASDSRIAEVAVTGGNPLFIRSRVVAAAAADAAPTLGTRYTFVSPEYFSILRIPIVRGRPFRADEAGSAAPVAIVSAATARAFWPGDDPIGKSLRIERPDGRPVDDLPGYSRLLVVGVARDVVSGLLFDGYDPGHIYLPVDATNAHAVALLLRGRTDREPGPEVLQQLFTQAAADPQVFEAVRLGEMKALQMYPLRAASWTGAMLGAIALVLSVSGLYGVLAYTWNQRTKEIGIRIALGATAGMIVRLVMRHTARMAGAGMIIGLVTALAALATLASVVTLRQVALVDAVAFSAGLAVVLAAAALAACQPARRATRVDASEMLRSE